MTTVSIGTVAELQAFAARVNAGETTLDAILTADINLTGVAWTPIGTDTYPYTGTFDGDGHTLSAPSDKFAYIGTNSVVQNTIFSGLATSLIRTCTGTTMATLSNCKVADSTLTTTNAAIIDGVNLYLDVYNCIFENCSVNITNTGTYGKCGAIFKERWDYSCHIENILINNCAVYANFAAGTAQSPRVGFLFGDGSSVTVSSIAMLDTNVSSNQSTSYQYLFGYGPHGTSLYHDDLCTVRGTCPTSTDATGYDGALTSDLHTQSFYEDTMGWDFADTWYWDSTDNLPKLQVFRPAPTVHVYTGSEWVEGTPYVYDGTDWKQAEHVHVYDGTAWQEKT